MVRHAHAEGDKRARRDEILGAALALFLDDTRRLPAVAAIAAEAGLAKGTVYLYFRTKEEIFSALLSREWDAVLADVEASFAGHSGDQASIVGRFILNYASFLETHPYFLRLDSLGYGHLETNLPIEEFWLFKQSFTSTLEKAAGTVDKALKLHAGHGVQLLVRSYALTRGLWQTLDYPDRLKGDPRFQEHLLARADFHAELKSALEEYWQGALSLAR
jgi:AcrR family transcriptional regulator